MAPKNLNASYLYRLMTSLFRPVDIASIVFFRIAFGLIMCFDVWLFFDAGWINKYWIEPTFHFKYYGFSWVHPWPGDWMYIHFMVLGVLAFFIAIGLLYRISAVLFFLGWTYVILLDQTKWVNHNYLICLISFLLIFVPAHRSFSVDSWWRDRIRSDTVPAWSLWLLRVQIGIPYFFGGLSKLNGDWLRGQPMSVWLHKRSDYFLIGPLFEKEWVVYLFSYGGLLLDLLIVPLILWRRTRVYAFVLVLYFHLMNIWLFEIGIFPWLMIAATLLFLPPGWPRRIFKWWRRESVLETEKPETTPSTKLLGGQLVTMVLIVVYISIQLLVPLRHFLYPGNVNWTEEGHRFSWHMMLRNKRAISRFYATDKESNSTWEIDLDSYLTPIQIVKMPMYPDMVLQFSHFLADEFRKGGYDNIEIRAKVIASLNYRKPQYFIDPKVNLANEENSLLPVKWILPLKYPLPPASMDKAYRIRRPKGPIMNFVPYR